MQQPVALIPPPATGVQPFDMSAVVSRQAELSSTLSRLRLEQQRIVREIQSAGGTPSASAQQELVQVDLAIADAQAKLASARAEIDSRISSSTTMMTMSPPFDSAGGVLPIFFVLGIGVVVAIVGAVALKAWRRSRGERSPAEASDFLSARLDRVDQSLDAIAIEVERIAESQRFVAKALADLAGARGK
jgi:hypothetical protein